VPAEIGGDLLPSVETVIGRRFAVHRGRYLLKVNEEKTAGKLPKQSKRYRNVTKSQDQS
jgi:hypothetical protein